MRRQMTLAGVLAFVAVAIMPSGLAVASNKPAPTSGVGPSITYCDFETKAPLSTICQKAKWRALHHPPHTVSPSASSGTYYGCTNSGLPLKGAAISNGYYVDSQLDVYRTTGYMCYYFFGTNGQDNNFDADDNWEVEIRTWICGTFHTAYSDAGTGPEAQADTPVLYYGNCGPQADNTTSIVDIDYSQKGFPYVHW